MWNVLFMVIYNLLGYNLYFFHQNCTNYKVTLILKILHKLYNQCLFNGFWQDTGPLYYIKRWMTTKKKTILMIGSMILCECAIWRLFTLHSKIALIVKHLCAIFLMRHHKLYLKYYSVKDLVDLIENLNWF